VRAADGLHADFSVFVSRAQAANVRHNSQLFVSSPSVLGEAYLEIGPPAGGAAPGPAVTDGERLRGADPPDLDRFFLKAEASIREVLTLLREHRPELDALLAAGDSLLATLSGLPADPGQLRRIVDQGAAALDDGRALVTVLRDSGGVDRLRHIRDDLSQIADRAAPDLRQLGTRLQLALDRLDGLRDFVPPDKRAQVATALDHLRRAAALGERIVADVRALEQKLRAGQGTIGALMADHELFDDLHETHRIIKSQPLRFLLKTVKPSDRVSP
jgi:ABC-type transporter Mla subunit MlaD